MRSYVVTFPEDLAAGTAVAVVCSAVLLAEPDSTLLRFAAGAPLLLFVPGYAVVTALFPGTRERTVRGSATPRRNRGIDIVERVGLSLGLSIAAVPLVAMVLFALGSGLELAPLVVGVALLSTGGFLVGWLRRRRLPSAERFDPSLTGTVEAGYGATVGAESRFEGGLNVALALAVIAAAGAFGFALAAPQATESGTNLMVLTQNSDGSYVAGEYPALGTGDPAELSVGVTNQEGQAVEYTVVVELQRVRQGGDGLSVLNSREVTTLSETVEPGETWYADHSVTADMSGENIRLTYLLYRGGAPADPGVDSAYRQAYLWVSGDSE